MSTYNLITELCSELIGNTGFYSSSKKKNIVKKLRSRAFEIVLSNRNVLATDVVEDSVHFLLANILFKVHSKAKVKGQWTETMMEDVGNILDNAEKLAGSCPSFKPVLKFFLCLEDESFLADTAKYQEFNTEIGMKIIISDHTFKHKPLIQPQSPFNPKIFEMPAAIRSGNDKHLLVMNEKPGIGLKHKQFFTPSGISTIVGSTIFEEDVNNGNWFCLKLNNMTIPLRNTTTDPRSSMPQDEGYETPDQDLLENQDRHYIPWERMDLDFNLVYNWENFGSAVVTKEPPFILESRDAIVRVNKIIHASNLMSARESKKEITSLKIVSIEELEVAFKNLLVGVESTIFQYDKEKNSFVLQKGMSLEGSTALLNNTLEEYCEDFIECGNRFLQLSEVTGLSRGSGLVFQMLCNSIRQYLQCYRGVVLKMPPMQSLLETRDWLHNISTQMRFLISLCPSDPEHKCKDLLLYLCDKMPVHYRHDLAYAYYYILQSCFTVYFTFLNKWIFEGVTNSIWEEEFFIKCHPLTDDMYNRKFWDNAFELKKELVPNCLKGLENELLLCGKSLALLNLCASDDPICKQAKREHQEIICCFNKTDFDEVEEKFRLYKEKIKIQCKELFDNAAPEIHDENYYAARMAKTLDEIKGRLEEERLIKAEKKQFEFNLLKKDMEDAKARKIEEKNIILDKERELLKEAEKIDHLNDLRRQEEREKIMQLYSSLSAAADRRRDRAEWKVKRAELYEKRCAFWKKENEWLEDKIKNVKDKFQFDEESKILSAEKSLEKYLETYSPLPGSGDYVPIGPVLEKSLEETHMSPVQHFEKDLFGPGLLAEGDNVGNNLESEEKKYCTQDLVESDRREWLIALDVAEQARNSALKFKQRNMHNDYNIITGEETTFESKFGDNQAKEIKEESSPCKTTNPNSIGNYADIDKVLSDAKYCVPVINEMSVTTCDNSLNKTSDVEVENFGSLDGSNKQMFSKTNESKQEEPSTDVLEMNIPASKFLLNTSFTSTLSENEAHQEIDMTSIYRHVQRSVMIPLLTQLELTNDAILRLFNKHNLLKHMECISKYFFLLEGEFAHTLTASLFREAQKSQHPSYLLNVMKLNSLLRCAVTTNLDEDYTERLSFYVNEMPSVFRSLDPEMLDCLSLRYKTHWPINIIITDDLITKQDKIFKHLLKLHRVSWALEETIYLLKDKRLLNSEEYRKVQLYRHVMTHFINTVKQYITAAVIEQSWYKFNKKFQNARTVDKMHELYQQYIKDINSKCLLGKAKEHTEQYFNTLFKEILIYYEALRSGEWKKESVTHSYRHSNFSRIKHAFDNFKMMASHLLYLFGKMAKYHFAEIEQLVTALSMNDFYKVKREHCL